MFLLNELVRIINNLKTILIGNTYKKITNIISFLKVVPEENLHAVMYLVKGNSRFRKILNFDSEILEKIYRLQYIEKFV